jgi:hypothetical protein
VPSRSSFGLLLAFFGIYLRHFLEFIWPSFGPNFWEFFCPFFGNFSDAFFWDLFAPLFSLRLWLSRGSFIVR